MLSCLFGILQFFNLAQHFTPWVNDPATGEVFANLRQRNQFASLTNIGLLSLLILLALNRWPGGRVGLALAMTTGALLGVGDALAVSRTGPVQLLLVFALAASWGWRNQGRLRWGLWSAVLAYAFVSLGLALRGEGPSIFGRFADEAPLCSSRLTLWANVLHLTAQKPLLGWGPGNLDYAHFTNLYSGERFCDILDNAHNLPLHLAVELGLPVALLVCGGFVWWVWRQRPWAEVHPTRQLAWGVMGLILLHSMVEYPLWYGPFFMSLVLCLWMLHRVPPGTPVDAPEAGPIEGAGASRSWLAKSLAAALLCATAYAAWDYWRISQIYLPPEQRHAAYREDTLEKIRPSWLFAAQVRFAEVVLTPVERANAAAMRELTEQTLHYSPEPRVIEKRIEASSLLGLDAEVVFYALRYKIAFPQDYAKWVTRNAQLAEQAGRRAP